MASTFNMSNVAVNIQADALAVLANSGYLRIYDGIQPANADTAVTTQTKLAELRFGSPAFMTSVSGLIEAYPVTADVSADATGTATWFRALESDGTTVLWDGSVGTTGTDMVLSSTAISIGTLVEITALTHTVVK